MSKIDIGIPIDLEKFISSRLLVQASSGGGKSYAIRKLAEECIGKVQVIIIDIEGEFVSLREQYPFALVSKGGEIPLNIRYAETLAHKLLETNLSAIIDMSEMEVYQRRIFAKRFATALIESPKNLWHPVVIIIDEADFFAPQGKESESTQAIINLSSRGRKRGVCPVYATQRIAKLHKDVTADVLNKIIGLTGQDVDQKRAGDELGFASRADVVGLRKLSPGEFYGFGPAISNEVVKFRVSKVHTTHMEAGHYKQVPPPTPAAIKKILSKLEAIPEEAEKELNSKKQLQDEIKRLNAELKKKPIQPLTDYNANANLKQEVATLKQSLQEEKRINGQYNKLAAAREVVLSKIVNMIQNIQEEKIDEPKTIGLPLPKDFRKVTKVMAIDTAGKVFDPVEKYKGDIKLPPGERAVLIACAQFGHALGREQLTVLTGYKRSSRDAYIARLKEKGLVEQNGDGIQATEGGIAFLGDNFEPLPTGEDLQEYWLNRLPPGEKAILKRLIDCYPDAAARDDLSQATGYQRSSRDAYIARMAAKELVVQVGRGEVKASDNLFN